MNIVSFRKTDWRMFCKSDEFVNVIFYGVNTVLTATSMISHGDKLNL